MLHLRISDEPSGMDIDREFDRVRIEDRPVVRKILNKLEQGSYHSPYDFCDRFGDLLDISCLCTGTKAALLVLFRPDEEINLIGCGYNAIGNILNFVRDGHVVVHSDICLASVCYDDSDCACDVALDGYRFTDIARLNEYITEYYPAPFPYLYDNVEELEPHDLSVYEELFQGTRFPPPGTRVCGV